MQFVSRLFKRVIANSKLEQLLVPSQQLVFRTSKSLSLGRAAKEQSIITDSLNARLRWIAAMRWIVANVSSSLRLMN